jgi:hypothetical protein
LFFVVLSKDIFREPEIPIGWGALVELDGNLELVRKPTWNETGPEQNVRLLERIAAAGTRALNRGLRPGSEG